MADEANMKIVKSYHAEARVGGSTLGLLGCLGAGIVAGAWLGSCGVQMGLEIAASIFPYREVSREVHSALLYLFDFFHTFGIPGALAFAGMVLSGESIVVLQVLPRRAWGWWAAATVVGGVICWIVAWLLYQHIGYSIINGLEDALSSTERGTFAEQTVLLQIAGIGALGGGLSGAILGLAQWLVLCRHFNWAVWWPVAMIVASAFFIAVAVTFPALFSHGGTWN